VSGRRRRSEPDEDGEGRKKRVLVWLAWALVVALLGGNLMTSSFFDKGFLTPEVLRAAAFWIPTAVAVAMSSLGIYWSGKAYSQSERSSLLWARRGYFFGLIGSGVFVLACFEPEEFPREWIVAVAAAVVAGQALFFGMMSFKEFRRAKSGGGGRRERTSEPGVAASAVDAPPPAASPDAAK
jgi:hypothetical protein